MRSPAILHVAPIYPLLRSFIGVVARKQLFVMIYAYFLYVHFVINLIVGIYFLVTVRQSNRQQLVNYCSEVFVDTSVESSCARLMNVSTYVFIAIVAALLLLELCESSPSRLSRLPTRKRRNIDRSPVRASPTHPEARRPVTTPRLLPCLLHSQNAEHGPFTPSERQYRVAPFAT